jgi:hypothetical protein
MLGHITLRTSLHGRRHHARQGICILAETNSKGWSNSGVYARGAEYQFGKESDGVEYVKISCLVGMRRVEEPL